MTTKKKGKSANQDDVVMSFQSNPILFCIMMGLAGLGLVAESQHFLGATSVLGAYISVAGLTLIGLSGLTLYRRYKAQTL